MLQVKVAVKFLPDLKDLDLSDVQTVGHDASFFVLVLDILQRADIFLYHSLLGLKGFVFFICKVDDE